MATSNQPMLSIVVPVYNESRGLSKFHDELTRTLRTVVNNNYEIVYCDDGSTDETANIVHELQKRDSSVRLISLSRNFGKESALTAGISQAKGSAIITLDGDGQHPIKLIPEFVQAWQKGVRVVIGVRTNSGGGLNLGSKFFYSLFNSVSKFKLVPGSTDYRLIDRSVQIAFKDLTETNRITRGLIDWLGFEHDYIYFKASDRTTGQQGYGLRKRLQLATNSFVALTPQPLYIFGYIGSVIMGLSLILGILVFVEQLLLGDPLNWNFSGTAMLGILIIFLVGLLLISQSILSMYIANIQSQSQKRPLYVIDYKKSIGADKS